jgi:hypothetical protein
MIRNRVVDKDRSFVQKYINSTETKTPQESPRDLGSFLSLVGSPSEEVRQNGNYPPTLDSELDLYKKTVELIYHYHAIITDC